MEDQTGNIFGIPENCDKAFNTFFSVLPQDYRNDFRSNEILLTKSYDMQGNTDLIPSGHETAILFAFITVPLWVTCLPPLYSHD
jgi:hypothetical protein